jgi:hypothetical protein
MADLMAVSLADLPKGPEPPQVYLSENTIDIFGGGSPYTARDPYSIRNDQVRSTAEALHWMAHLAGKRWAHGESFWHSLARALEALVDRARHAAASD